MNELDYIIITVLLISVLIGTFRGFIKEMLKLLNVTGASYGALYFRSYISAILSINQSELVPKLICSTLIWICMFIGGNFIVYVLCKLLHIQGLIKIIDKLLGIGYGFARCFAICLIVVYVIERNSLLVNDKMWQQSLLINETKVISVSLEKNMPDTWKSKINEITNINTNSSNSSSSSE